MCKFVDFQLFIKKRERKRKGKWAGKKKGREGKKGREDQGKRDNVICVSLDLSFFSSIHLDSSQSPFNLFFRGLPSSGPLCAG